MWVLKKVLLQMEFDVVSIYYVNMIYVFIEISEEVEEVSL